MINQKRAKNKEKDFFLKRAGKFFLRLFFAFLLLKILINVGNADNIYPIWTEKLADFSLVFTSLLALLFLWPYRKTVLVIKQYFSSLEVRGEADYTRAVLNCSFYTALIVYLILLLINQFKEVHNLEYALLLVLFLGIISTILHPKQNK